MYISECLDQPLFNGPGETEWDDILIKHKVIEKPYRAPHADTVAYKEMEAYQEREAKKEPLEDVDTSDLSDFEDDIDDQILAQIRKKRTAEFKAIEAGNIFGQVKEIREPEFIKEVTEASKTYVCVLHLFVYGKEECRLMMQHMSTLAGKLKNIKFMKIVAQEAIHTWPDSQCPTIIIYKNGALLTQIIGLERYGGRRMTAASLEYQLAGTGAFPTSIKENPMVKKQKTSPLRRNYVMSRDADNEDDSESEQNDRSDRIRIQ